MRFLFILLSLLPIKVWAQDTTARAMPGYMGTYTGKLPCESCSFIASELTLEYDTDTSGVFNLRDKYMSEKGTNMTSAIKGEYHVVKEVLEGKPVLMLVLNRDNSDAVMYYLVKSRNELIPLSREKQFDLPKDCSLKKL